VNKPETGGSAFPFVTAVGQSHHGMSLRDYFAAMAMQVLIANDETDLDEDAQDAYMIADKMLKARGQT
jgi:hypothetical protein